MYVQPCRQRGKLKEELLVNNLPKIRKIPARFFAAMIASLGICCFIGSCAGGTIGTGLAISGMLETTGPVLLASASLPASLPATGPKTPLAGVLVTAVGTSARDVTDTEGRFDLFVDDRPGNVQLQFKGKTFTSTYEVADIPPDAGQVDLKLSFNPENDEITKESESFQDEQGNEISDGNEDSSGNEKEKEKENENGGGTRAEE